MLLFLQELSNTVRQRNRLVSAICELLLFLYIIIVLRSFIIFKQEAEVGDSSATGE